MMGFDDGGICTLHSNAQIECDFVFCPLIQECQIDLCVYSFWVLTRHASPARKYLYRLSVFNKTIVHYLEASLRADAACKKAEKNQK